MAKIAGSHSRLERRLLRRLLSFHEVCGVDITTQTPVQACLLFGEQVKLTPANWANDFKTCQQQELQRIA